MRTVLHIGTPKTGTTALQSTLLGSYDILLDRGVLYPKCGRGVRFKKHILLMQPFVRFEDLPRSLRQDGATAADIARWHGIFFDAVRAQINSEKPKCLVLSSETLSRDFTADQWHRFREELRGLGVGEVEVAAYLRRPSSHFLSGLQQRLKASHRLKQPGVGKLRSVLEGYSNAFGAEHVRPRVFDRAALVDGDIVADFCASYLADEGVDPGRLRPGDRSNESMSAESMEIVLRYRMDFERDNNDMHTKGSRLLRSTLRDLEEAAGVSRPRLRDGVADMIDYSSTDVLWLRDTYGIEFRDLDYSRLEKGGPSTIPDRTMSLDEIVSIDPEVKERLLAGLARSRWARKEKARRHWISDLMKETA